MDIPSWAQASIDALTRFIVVARFEHLDGFVFRFDHLYHLSFLYQLLWLL